MDDLTSSVNSIFVSEDDNALSTQNHTRLDIYKKKSSLISNQTERRRIRLQEQKKKRESKVESIRFRPPTPQKKTSPAKKSYINPLYSNQLMFSEWLIEVPSDLDKNWIMAICPVGKRCLVVASEGITSVYNKVGKLITKHSSRLPGGFKESKTDYTILDCVYNDPLRSYYILDCLCWKSHPIVDSETEFRFYWLKCKLDESKEISAFSCDNPYAFKDVPRISALNPNKIQSQFTQKFEYDLDGVLFYHKEAHYEPGCSPLVGWLKAYMIPEILGVAMPDWVLKQAPSDYVNVRNSIEKFEFEQKMRFEDKIGADFKTDGIDNNLKNIGIGMDFNESSRLEI